MANRVTRRPPLSPSVYLASGSHSSTTTFSNHTPAKGTFSWQWPKWSCELDAFCNSAKRVIRDLGSVLQPDHDELVRFELNYFSRSGLDGDAGGIGASEGFQGVGDNESSGGYLSDISPDYSHGPAQLLSTACTDHEAEVESYHPPRRASPRFSEIIDSTASLAAVANFTEAEYTNDEDEEEERYLEGRGRSLCGEMAGTVIAAPGRERSEKRDKSVHKHEDPGERERRRAERRKRKVDKEERKEREVVEERERTERRQERQERHERHERHERRKQREERAPKPEVIVKERSPKLTIEEYLSGFAGNKSRSMLGVRRGSTGGRPDVRPKLTIKRSKSTVLMKAPEKQAPKEPIKERRHRDHHDHSTPDARADCLRCLKKREKKEKLENITIVPLPRVHEAALARSRVDRFEKVGAKNAKSVIGEKEKAKEDPRKKTRPALGFVIEKKPERMVECVTCLADDIPIREAAELSCGHYWCNDCLKRIFTLSLTDPAHMPPKCCTEDHVPLKHVDQLLNYQTKKLWNKKYIEYTTANRIYCPEPNCGEWIQPKEIQGNIGKCSRCKTKVCSMCNGKAHGDGECPKDEDLLKFIETAKKNKFQRCYSCRAMVELERGCNHMTCRCTAEFCYVCGDKWKTCECPWFNYEPEEDDDYIVPEWNANDLGIVIPANILERREQRARARAEQMRQDEDFARQLAQEEREIPSPAIRGDIFSDEYYLPSPIRIDPLAALGTIGSGLRDGIRRIAADYVETATRATPQSRLERRRTGSVSRTAPRNRSREEIRENISNLIQEVEELSKRSRSPQRPRFPRVETAPEVRTGSVIMEPRERSSIAPSRYLSGAQQAHIQEYLRGIDLEDPEPVAPPLPSPHMSSSRTYEPAFPELRRSRTERIPRRRRGEHDVSAEYTDHTPLEVIDRMSRLDSQSRLGSQSRLDTQSRTGTESTFRRVPSIGSRAGLTEHRWRYAQQNPGSQGRMPVDGNLGAWRWGAESRGY